MSVWLPWKHLDHKSFHLNSISHSHQTIYVNTYQCRTLAAARKSGGASGKYMNQSIQIKRREF